MTWNFGSVWLKPGESEHRWPAVPFVFGDPPPWIGPQMSLPRASRARSVIAVRDPGTECQPITAGSVYWATHVNVGAPGDWASFDLTGGGLV